MKQSTFLTIAAVVAFLFGLSFLLIPVQTMAFYGVPLDTAGASLGRYFGSALFGISFIVWFARKAKADNEALQAVILGGLVLCLGGLAVALLDIYIGEGNSWVWSTVVIYILLALGFGYFKFKK